MAPSHDRQVRLWASNSRDQRWSFVRNHARAIVACDLCTVVTARFQVLYMLQVHGAASAASPPRHPPHSARVAQRCGMRSLSTPTSSSRP
jgi:hypothetical protein